MQSRAKKDKIAAYYFGSPYMIVGTVCFIASAVCAVLFWVWAVRAILARIYKTRFGKKNAVRLIVFGAAGWVFFFIGAGSAALWLWNGGTEKLSEKASYAAALTRESARKGWSAGLLKKLDTLDFELESVQEVEDEFRLTSSALHTFEATLIVNNPNGKSDITYKELRQANVAYAEDTNGVFIPAFVVNHSSADEIPWLFRFLLPSYRRESESPFVPSGRSYLNLRFDIGSHHHIASICLGDKKFAVDTEKIEPLKKDDSLSRLGAELSAEQSE